jgi:hypothetical protein
MKIRDDVYQAYWRFAAERQAVFLGRLRDEPPPWTRDSILREYKFCNTFRASDRVSQFLIRDVIYKHSFSESDTIFRILLFRFFNRIDTWRFLEGRVGPITLETFDRKRFGSLLQSQLEKGRRVFGGAFILCAHKAYGFDQKHRNFLALIDAMFADQVDKKILGARSMQSIYELLLGYPLLGRFMAYQLLIDLNYSEVLNFSENDFTVAGPGAERGIRKCFHDTGGMAADEVIKWMVDRQEEEFARYGLKFDGLFGRPLHAIDCQGLFCEVDKYSRVAFPELRSNRTRIKASFRPSAERLTYFYPPKWKINHRIPGALASSASGGFTQGELFGT